ncbi:hypothetical protein H112_07355 [Trichophyton rubrum D6]|uniref:Oxysterol binding protein n=5 Tax=Trichophyton TaxID=5550 RepID=F2SII7_TRIRC|nr:uncharacterized protein TERG_02675 [Trichophyton rubrum CBS 118892]EZF11542.1 hypothetical protein H100_07382 [Trichophyton rubrum MR850]EZF38393.1 hypothetical protein H102_07344 [Trichophyton rubrum CBS 100081]EZF49057.1 hypothetical protein H103_07366 [Trichophyton rubrum CBS 288.86]EZF59688.1 hypothetical protein H104_07318 [Trichophyton rubrum CBS 289.86]EZF80974.1 hypothetical protein H110_07364 [Trichophyton rubrum MR1448]EZF91651.1 hypothetical protein H113_07418 [Trichophyton rubr
MPKDDSLVGDAGDAGDAAGDAGDAAGDAGDAAGDAGSTTDLPVDDSSKLRAFLSILRNFIGVSDIASVRFSLPAQLLEPIPNLEYWNYLDRPESFASIGKSDDELGRMLEVLRFWFTKDLKYVKGKPCKPYNSVLGEFFRCNWEVKDTEAAVSLPAAKSASRESIAPSIASTAASTSSAETVKISYITEQTSHHPPVSAFWVDCPQRGITARGFDQISAKFTGTSVRITPGQHNLGIFITLARRDNEEYRLTHPDAHLGGLLRGALSVSVADTCYVTCPRTKIKAILQYLEDGWLGKAQHRVVGAVFRYDPDNDCVARIKDIPAPHLLAEISGSWHERIYFNLPSNPKDKQLLIDVTPLFPAAKITPPPEKQLAYESRRLWADITAAIHAKQYSLATRLKHELEESQRSKAALRRENKHEWTPRFFAVADQHIQPGRPHLTDDGRKALDNLHRDVFDLDEKLTSSGEFDYSTSS